MIELLLGVDFELGSDIYDWAPLGHSRRPRNWSLQLDVRQCELRLLQPRVSPVGTAFCGRCGEFDELRRRYPASCALQVGNGVLPRLRLGGFLARSLRRPPVEDGRLELLLH